MTDLPRLLARLHLRITGDHMLFGFGSGQDYADSTQVIAFASSGGLGLPDRDYYLKTDAKSQETRAKYVEHVQRMCSDSCWGRFAGNRRRERQDRNGHRNRVRQGYTLGRRVEQRDPYKLYAALSATAQGPDSGVPLGQFTSPPPARPVVHHRQAQRNRSRSSSPSALQVAQLTHRVRSADWKTYLRWHYVDDKAPHLSSKFVQTDFDFYRRYLHGLKEMPRRWQTLRPVGRSRSWRSAGTGLRREDLQRPMRRPSVRWP